MKIFKKKLSIKTSHHHLNDNMKKIFKKKLSIKNTLIYKKNTQRFIKN